MKIKVLIKSFITYMAICLTIVVLLPSEIVANDTAKDMYFKAGAAYEKLRNNPKTQNYRENWMSCIKQYQNVYRHNTSGPWAAAGMYKTGELYYELYKRSFKETDKTKSLEILTASKYIFPNSAYRHKADSLIAKIKGPDHTITITAPKNVKRIKKPVPQKKEPSVTQKKAAKTQKPKRLQQKSAIASAKAPAKQIGQPPSSSKPVQKDKKKRSPSSTIRIVIDPGHGGWADGAPGYIKGVFEKKVVLDIASKLALKLINQTRCEVIMTRSTDVFLKLEERTEIANKLNADIFISIHTNAHTNKNVYGIETYILNVTDDKDALRVAAMENDTSVEQVSDLQLILTSLMQTTKVDESTLLAGHVQNSIYKHLKKKYKKTKNYGIKQAPFYVLLGANMPCILVETGFISNPQECKKLINSKYQDLLCDAMLEGIKGYLKEIGSTAYLKKHK